MIRSSPLVCTLPSARPLSQVLASFLAKVPREQLDLVRFPPEPERFFGCGRAPALWCRWIPLLTSHCARAAGPQVPRAPCSQVRRCSGSQACRSNGRVAKGERNSNPRCTDSL